MSGSVRSGMTLACLLALSASAGCLDEQLLNPPVPNPYGLDGRAAVITFLQEHGVKGRFHTLTDQEIVDVYSGFIDAARAPAKSQPARVADVPAVRQSGPKPGARSQDGTALDIIRLQLAREFGVSLPQDIAELEARRLLDDHIRARREGGSVTPAEVGMAPADAHPQQQPHIRAATRESQADANWAETRSKVVRESPWKGMDDAQVRAAALGQHDWDMKERLGWPTDQERIVVDGVEGERWIYKDRDKYGEISRVMRVTFIQRVCTEITFAR